MTEPRPSRRNVSIARVLRRSLQKVLDAALVNGARYLEAGAERVAPTLETL